MKSLQYYSISLGNLLRGVTDIKRVRPWYEKAVSPPFVEVKIPTAIDTSHYDPPTDWSLIPKTVVFMGTKATEGTYYRDPTFPEIFTKTKTILGIHRLAYHFFRKAYDPIKQADWFINYIEPYLDDTDILCLDFEEGGETASQLWAFLNRVIQRCPNNQLMIYSRKDLMNAIVMTASEKAFFKSIPSWVAGYPYNPNIYTTTPEGYKPDPTKWGEVWMWQYSDAGQVAGFDGAALDVNLIEKPLLDYIGGTGETPPPTGDKMKYDAKAIGNSTKTRPNHNTVTDFNPSRYYNAGTVFSGDEFWVADSVNKDVSQFVGDKWLKVKEIDGLPIIGDAWVAITHKGEPICTLKENVVAPPPASVTVTNITIQLASGSVVTTEYSDGTKKVETA